VLTPSVVIPSASAAQTAAAQSAPLDIKDGDVALAIPADPGGGGLGNVGGFVAAEDHIDILIDTGTGTIKYAFQDIRILKVGNAASQPVAGPSDTPAATPANAAPTLYIVEVPRGAAEQLTYLFGNKGRQIVVKYVLRKHSDYGKGYVATGDSGFRQAPDAGATPTIMNGLFGG
jgi:hypothetical protein